jgi:hypothetical protein
LIDVLFPLPTAVMNHRGALIEELLPRFLLVDFDRDFDATADGAAGGSTATASISRRAPSRANPEIAMVVLASLSVMSRLAN